MTWFSGSFLPYHNPDRAKLIPKVILALGSVTSIVFLDFAWLARAGCILTLVSIGFGVLIKQGDLRYWGTEESLEELLSGKNSPRNERERRFLFLVNLITREAEWEIEWEKHELDDGFGESYWGNTYFEPRREFTIDRQLHYFSQIQLNTALLGGFVWGFGDLPNYLIII